MHQDTKVEGEKQKLEIILHYNATISGEDNNQKKTRRQPEEK